MLGLQVIQALTTILLIIRQLEVTQVAVTIIRPLLGMAEIMQIIPLISMHSMLQIPVLHIVLVLRLPLHKIISNTTSNGQIITVKQKSAVLLGLRTFLLLVHPMWDVRFQVLPLGIKPRTSSYHHHLRTLLLGGQNPVHLNCHQCRFEFPFMEGFRKSYMPSYDYSS